MILLAICGFGMILVLFWKKKVEKRLFFLVLCGNLLGLALTVQEGLAGKRQEVTALERGGYGEIPEEVELEVETEDGERTGITIQIPGRQYSAEEVQKLLSEKLMELDRLILGENRSLSHIEYDLDLPSSFSDSPVTVEWSTDLPSVLNWDGTVGEAAGYAGTEVCLEGILSLQDQTEDYRRTLVVYPSPDSDNLKARLKKKTEQINEGNKSISFDLPAEINGRKITWYQKQEQTGALVSVLSLAAGGLAVFSANRKKEQELLKHQEEMQKDYPELVSKIQLFLGAGISMRRVFERITLDYRKELNQNRRACRRWAYEEAARTWYEIDSGVSEQEAYERFGLRCGIPSYKGLSILLIQNLKKGGKGLLPLLEQEAQAAFEARKRQARVEGEKAAVKLLLPMGMMLLVVLIILMVPAFLSF